jgi:hypothetical protein
MWSAYLVLDLFRGLREVSMKIKTAFFSLLMMLLVIGAASAATYSNPCASSSPNVRLCVPYGSGLANVYTFMPQDRDMNDLEHDDLYYWGINVTNAINAKGFDPDDIIGARIIIRNLYNDDLDLNKMHINLLDGRPTNFGPYTKDGRNVWVWEDQLGNTNDFFSSDQPMIRLTQWSDTDGPKTHNNRIFNLDGAELAMLISFIENDNKFGIGIDPDSIYNDGNYYNDRIKLKIYTKYEVPEPGTLLLLSGSAFAGLVFFRKWKL